MKIVLTDYRQRRECDSRNPEVIAAWFKEKIPELMNLNVSLPPVTVEIWAESEEEITEAKKGHYRGLISPGDYAHAFRELGYLFLAIAGKAEMH